MQTENGLTYNVEKITRSCEKSISHNYCTHKVSTMLSVSVEDRGLTKEQVEEIGKDVYKEAEKMTLAEIKEIQRVLSLPVTGE